MSNEISYCKDEICDDCGKQGGYDFMGDIVCVDCLNKRNNPTIEALRVIRINILESNKRYKERTGKDLKPPYPADSPCYYCYLLSYHKDACQFCIQNPDAILYRLTSCMMLQGSVFDAIIACALLTQADTPSVAHFV